MVKPLISGQLDTFSVDFYIACLHAWLGTCDTEETGKESDKGNLERETSSNDKHFTVRFDLPPPMHPDEIIPSPNCNQSSKKHSKSRSPFSH